MTNAIMDTTRAANIEIPTISNPELHTITNDIFALGFNMRLVAKQIAAKVAYVRDNADRLCGEFDAETPAKRFEVWGTQILGLKRAQLNAFAKVGKELLFSDGAVSILADKAENLKGINTEVQEFTMSQLQTIVPLGIDKIDELVYDGKIKPSMTVLEIKEVVNENDPKKEEKEARKAKREQEKKEKQKEQQKIHGEEIANIKINRLDNGSLVVTLNGEDITKTNVGKYLIKNLCK